MFNFEKLEIYKEGLRIANNIFNLTKTWPREYLHSLSDQIKRASLSIPLNIAEGSSKSSKEFKRYLSISRGSCFECIPLFEIAFLQNLITRNDKEIWYNTLLSLAKRISSLKAKL